VADLETAKAVLRGLRLSVAEIEGGDFAVEFRSQKYVLTAHDLDTYASRKPQLKKATETQLFYPGYYEHVVQFEGTGPRRPYRRDEDKLALESSDGATRIEIGRPSPLFCLSLSDVDQFERELRRFAFGFSSFARVDLRSISDMFRLNTIKVTTDPQSVLGVNPTRLHELAEAAIFHFAYGQGIAISFTKSWARTYYWLGRKEGQKVQFPLRTYNSELVSYYNLALSTDSLVLGYLALYKILEYFYTSVSESALHQKVREHLVAPDFTHTKTKKLRDLIKAIKRFEAHLDELSQLKLVLAAHFDKADLRTWIESYEAKNGSYFTKETIVMGNGTVIDLNENAIIPNISSRIYGIRNALVHNKEGEVSRFIPYTGQEEILQKEVQILLYLAEQLIIKTGKDIV
jgi:hypothetical protein